MLQAGNENYFRNIDSIYRVFSSSNTVLPPYIVDLMVGLRGCNLQCAFCPGGEEPLELGTNETKETWRYLLNKILSYQVKTIINEKPDIAYVREIHLSHHQSDPSLSPFIGEIIEQIKSDPTPRDLTVITNGVAINKEKCLKAIVHADKVNISINASDAPSYIAQTKKDKYETVLQNIALLRELSIKENPKLKIFVSHVLFRDSFNDISNHIERLIAAGVDSISFRQNFYEKDIAVRREFENKIALLMDKYNSDTFTIVYKDQAESTYTDNPYCSASRIFCAVDPAGNVRHFIHQANDAGLGNLQEEDFAEIQGRLYGHDWRENDTLDYDQNAVPSVVRYLNHLDMLESKEPISPTQNNHSLKILQYFPVMPIENLYQNKVVVNSLRVYGNLLEYNSTYDNGSAGMFTAGQKVFNQQGELIAYLVKIGQTYRLLNKDSELAVTENDLDKDQYTDKTVNKSLLPLNALGEEINLILRDTQGNYYTSPNNIVTPIELTTHDKEIIETHYSRLPKTPIMAGETLIYMAIPAHLLAKEYKLDYFPDANTPRVIARLKVHDSKHSIRIENNKLLDEHGQLFGSVSSEYDYLDLTFAHKKEMNPWDTEAFDSPNDKTCFRIRSAQKMNPVPTEEALMQLKEQIINYESNKKDQRSLEHIEQILQSFPLFKDIDSFRLGDTFLYKFYKNPAIYQDPNYTQTEEYNETLLIATDHNPLDQKLKNIYLQTILMSQLGLIPAESLITAPLTISDFITLCAELCTEIVALIKKNNLTIGTDYEHIDFERTLVHYIINKAININRIFYIHPRRSLDERDTQYLDKKYISSVIDRTESWRMGHG